MLLGGYSPRDSADPRCPHQMPQADDIETFIIGAGAGFFVLGIAAALIVSLRDWLRLRAKRMHGPQDVL